MEHLDIPHFTVGEWRSMEHSIEDSDLWQLGRDRDPAAVLRRLEKLCPEDCERQLTAIEEAIHLRFPVALDTLVSAR